jgi:hypothetical protein
MPPHLITGRDRAGWLGWGQVDRTIEAPALINIRDNHHRGDEHLRKKGSSQAPSDLRAG